VRKTRLQPYRQLVSIYLCGIYSCVFYTLFILNQVYLIISKSLAAWNESSCFYQFVNYVFLFYHEQKLWKIRIWECPSNSPFLKYNGPRPLRGLGSIIFLLFVLSFFFWPLHHLSVFDSRFPIALWYLQTFLAIFILRCVKMYHVPISTYTIVFESGFIADNFYSALLWARIEITPLVQSNIMTNHLTPSDK
jgi:hypothetical protein